MEVKVGIMVLVVVVGVGIEVDTMKEGEVMDPLEEVMREDLEHVEVEEGVEGGMIFLP